MTDTAALIEAPSLSPMQEDGIRQQMIEALREDRGGGVGFAGAHRTGKTTLCELLAKDNPTIPFIRTSTKQIAAKFDFDVDAMHTFEHRLAFQEYVLLYHQAVWELQHGVFFTDRTPLDFAAYLMADVPAGEIDPALDNRVQSYLQRCIEATAKHFLTMIVIQPGIPYKPTPGSPALNMAYQEKINQLVLGFARAHLPRPHYVLDRSVTGLGERGAYCAQIVGKELGSIQSMLSWLTKQ